MAKNFDLGSYRQVPEAETPVETPKKYITKLAFMNRFTDGEAVAIDMASRLDTVQAAQLRRFLAKVDAATFIDLAREETIIGVRALEQIGLIGQGRAEAILSAPIQYTEIPKGIL